MEKIYVSKALLKLGKGCAICPTMKNCLLNVLTILHFASIAGLAVYGLHRIWMMAVWLGISRKDGEKGPGAVPPAPLPVVTVQIPLYNECRVAARVIDAVAAFDWPADRLEIQVLDDSTDETSAIVDQRVAHWAAKGRAITALRRSRRTGYKAGALAHGLARAAGEYIAIFDADFVPDPDFLKKILPYFTSPDIGMVQARWGFLNAGTSWLTRLQSLLLAAHFDIEHRVRCSRGLFFNFNGTAGIWRKSAIVSSGGWQSDTVTEDLDLSYRAQLRGWRFVYAHDVKAASELPMTLSDFRTQQERWIKGAVQTARKLLPALFRSGLAFRVKMEAAAHLAANCCWVFGCIATLTLYPMLVHRIGIGVYQIIWLDLPLFFLTGVAVLSYYALYSRAASRRHLLAGLPLLPAASIGLAPFFSLAVLKGLFQKGGVFVRTPKTGIRNNNAAGPQAFCGNRPVFRHLLMNLPLFCYTLAPVGFAWARETWPAIPFLCLFPAGFALVIAHDVREACRRKNHVR